MELPFIEESGVAHILSTILLWLKNGMKTPSKVTLHNAMFFEHDEALNYY